MRSANYSNLYELGMDFLTKLDCEFETWSVVCAGVLDSTNFFFCIMLPYPGVLGLVKFEAEFCVIFFVDCTTVLFGIVAICCVNFDKF